MKSGAPRYRFGPFTLDIAEHLLLRNGSPVHLTRKDFDLLVALVERAGQLVRKDELLERLWPDTAVEEGNLAKHVSMLRKALGDQDGAERHIETVPRVGFRFVAPVARLEDTDEFAPPVRGYTSGHVLAVVAILVAIFAMVVGFAGHRDRAPDTGPAWSAFAILPFATLGASEDPGLGVGLADGIITRLSAQRLIRVRPTSAGLRYAEGNRPDLASIAKALDAELLLDGHIRRVGETVRVSVQLIDVKAGAPVWAERFDERTDSLFRLEDAIATRVADALRLRLASAEQQRLIRQYTENIAAYRAYIEGRQELLRYTPDGTHRAVEAFERALALDPAYALARAGLAMASADIYLRFASDQDSPQWGERAEREAQRALAIAPDIAEAHLARAAVLRKREFDWDATIAESRRALVLNHNLEQAHLFIAAAFYHQGLMDDALEEVERGRLAGPIDRIEPVRVEGLVALFSGRFHLARQRLEQVSRMSSRAIGDTYLALTYYYLGDASRSQRMLEQLSSETSASTAARSQAALAGVLAATGDRAAARHALQRALDNRYRDHHVAYSLGVASAQLGEHRSAVEWLRTAAETGFPCVTWYDRDPLLEPLRQDGAFIELVAALSSRRAAAAARHRPS